MTTRFACPCCGFLTMTGPRGSYDICPVCFWEDDLIQYLNPQCPGGANVMSLESARQNFAEFGASDRRHLQHVRPAHPEETPDADPMRATADDVPSLGKVSNVVHDCWIDLERTTLVAGTFRIPLKQVAGMFSSASSPASAEGELAIHNVVSVELVDSERIGYYDINELKYDDRSGTIVVQTGVPLVLRLVVSSINVSAELKPTISS